MTSHSLTRLRAAVRGLYEISTASPRITVLEGLRGLAVLLVFFVHYHALFGAYARSNPLLWRVSHALGSIGNAGVDLFFVLSGYLIYGMLLRPGCSTLTFWRRRIVRVYPAFLAVLLLYLALSAVFPGRSKVGGSALGAALYVLENLLLLPGVFDIKPIVTVTWSLSYEFAFYWSLPVVIWLTGMRRWTSRWRTVFFIVIFTVSLACAFQAARSHCRLLMFVPGILLYEAVHAERESSGRSRRRDGIALASFLAALLLSYMIDQRHQFLAFLPGLDKGTTILPGVPNYQGPYKVIVFAPVFLLFFVTALTSEGFLKRALSWKPLRYLGNISYSYFLIHGIALHGLAVAVAALVGQPASGALFIAMLPLALLVTFAAGTVLFALIERPLSIRPKAPARQSVGLWHLAAGSAAGVARLTTERVHAPGTEQADLVGRQERG